MTFLSVERESLERFLPGLDAHLVGVALPDMEQRGNTCLVTFRKFGGPALLVPQEYGGRGATLLDAVRVQRAVGSRSPSLAVATTMHHFSVASLVELTAAGNGFEWALLTAIAENSWLLSSGFAEGKPGQHILSPTMQAVAVEGGLRVSGSKKPCSLTWSMDLISASVAVKDPSGGPDRPAIILATADSEGLERRPFWNSWALAGAESDEVELRDVFVPDALVFYPQTGDTMDPIQARGFVWFELLIAASYLGAASGLAERVIGLPRASDGDKALLAIELESASAALEHVASIANTTVDVDHLLSRALYVRYATERCIERAAMAAAAMAGGMAFIGSSDIAYLLAVSRALAFHPPSRAGASGPLAQHLSGANLTL